MITKQTILFPLIHRTHIMAKISTSIMLTLFIFLVLIGVLEYMVEVTKVNQSKRLLVEQTNQLEKLFIEIRKMETAGRKLHHIWHFNNTSKNHGNNNFKKCLIQVNQRACSQVKILDTQINAQLPAENSILKFWLNADREKEFRKNIEIINQVHSDLMVWQIAAKDVLEYTSHLLSTSYEGKVSSRLEIAISR